MKTAKCLFVFAAAFALSFSAFGKTGAEAAGGISSDPGAKNEKPNSASLEYEYYDRETKTFKWETVNVGPKDDWNAVYTALGSREMNINAVAYNALMALAKVAYLEAVNEYTQARIDTLTETTKAAIESLDTLTLKDVDNEITKVLTKQPKADDGKSGITYTGGGIFNVAGAQADGKSIASNSQDRLELYGLPQAAEDYGKIPFWSGSNLGWFFLKDLFDGVSVETTTDGEGAGIKNYGIGISGWKTKGACEANLSKMLTDPDDGNNRNAHKVLCRVNTGDDAVLHYLPLGDVIKAGGTALKITGTEGDPVVVGSGSSTNSIKFAAAQGSNVKVTVSGGAEDVTISIGVYYE